MADSSPAMVVGIRHTSSATSTTRLTRLPGARRCHADRVRKRQRRVTTTPRNTIVSATSRMVSAISLGVFWRLAFSTIAIMRSTKVSPGFTDHAHHDPVRQHARAAGDGFEKSPPDSRITGADSPVMALSSTEATPSITSPSAGTVPRRPRSAHVALAQVVGFERMPLHGRAQLACARYRLRVFLAQVYLLQPAQRIAAWALLRPSARASAKLANSTVNHSHSATAAVKKAGAAISKASAAW